MVIDFLDLLAFRERKTARRPPLKRTRRRQRLRLGGEVDEIKKGENCGDQRELLRGFYYFFFFSFFLQNVFREQRKGEKGETRETRRGRREDRRIRKRGKGDREKGEKRDERVVQRGTRGGE